MTFGEGGIWTNIGGLQQADADKLIGRALDAGINFLDTADGYAASASQAKSGGEQLCQHHCPVAHVAAEFPQLCEAETEAFGQLLGTPVQRLATIAHGDGVCTTHVSPHALASGREAPAGPRRGRASDTPDGSGVTTSTSRNAIESKENGR